MHLEPGLAEAVERARSAIADSRASLARPGFESPLDETERAAVAKMLRDGTYRRFANEITAIDPDLADL